MSKKQLIVLTFIVAAVPASALLVKMLFSMLRLLSDQSGATPLLWVAFVICLLGSVFIALLPLFLWLYYPAEGFAVAGNAGAMAAPETGGPEFNAGSDDEDEFEEDESADAEDDGERLFDDDDMEADDDEFDGGFDDEE
ncbi:MAG TPA: hypothetical protein PLY87_23425 [Planctomycetaceae bacterium]|nr:hypothetical protein [Planctomycetaceae bacterium]